MLVAGFSYVNYVGVIDGTHMHSCVLQKIKFHLLEEKVCELKMLWLHVALTCNSYLFWRTGKVMHTIHEFFSRQLTIHIKNSLSH